MASCTPEIWPGPQNVEMSNVTLTTPTAHLGDSQHHKLKANTSRGRLGPSSIRNVKYLAVAVAEIFQRV